MLLCISVDEYNSLLEDSLLIELSDIKVSQSDIDMFTNCSQDINWIHTQSKDNPLPIAHGNLVLSKCVKIITFPNVYKVVLLGYDLVRFIKPVFSGETIKALYKHKGIVEVDDNIFTTIISCVISKSNTNEIVAKMTYRLQHFLKEI